MRIIRIQKQISACPENVKDGFGNVLEDLAKNWHQNYKTVFRRLKISQVLRR